MENPTRERIIEEIGFTLQNTDCIEHARVYGSWLYNQQSVDMDVAVIVRSKSGVIQDQDYRTLRELRLSLCEKTSQDIDLVPHTDDEFIDRNSPLWYPRYNPSLVFGRNLKGSFQISSISTSMHSFSFADLTAHVLHDNRTICRRQLIRSLRSKEGRIFVSKLFHGPGNALTYHACRNRVDYTIPPSDLEGCFDAFDRLYGVNSLTAIDFLDRCKKSLDQEKAYLLMNWYEHLMNLVLHGDQFRTFYKRSCFLLGKGG